MSAFSRLVDGVFGAGSSDSAISGINDYTGVNLNFGLDSSSSTSTGFGPYADPTAYTTSLDSYKNSLSDSSKSSSFSLGDYFTPSNIIGGLGVYSQIAGKGDERKAAQAKIDAAIAASALDFERQKELIALKAALGGGGGGGGGGSGVGEQLAYDAKKTRYLGIQDAMKNRQAALGQGSENIIQAIKNLTEAAQRPLSR